MLISQHSNITYISNQSMHLGLYQHRAPLKRRCMEENRRQDTTTQQWTALQQVYQEHNASTLTRLKTQHVYDCRSDTNQGSRGTKCTPLSTTTLLPPTSLPQPKDLITSSPIKYTKPIARACQKEADTKIHPDEESGDDDDILHENMSQETKIQAMEKANKIMSKLHNDIHRKTNPTSHKSWLMATIRTIMNSTGKIILPHKYKFENTREAAKHNTTLLKKSKYDFVRAMQKELGTILEPGSEFRKHTDLQPLFSKHQHWPAMRDIISKGVNYNLEELSEETRKEDLEYMMKRGNHKSASEPENEPTLIKNY